MRSPADRQKSTFCFYFAFMIVGIFKEAGVKVNIIPERAVLEVTVRAPTDKEKSALKQKVVECFKAAAMATGCEVASGKHVLVINAILCMGYAGVYLLSYFCSKT